MQLLRDATVNKEDNKGEVAIPLGQGGQILGDLEGKVMSKAGRLQLLNSVLTSLAVYLMTIHEMAA